MIGESESAGHTDEQRHSIAVLIGRSKDTLHSRFRALNAICVDDNVLRGRRKSDGERNRGEKPNVTRWIKTGHKEQRNADRNLREQHPASAATEKRCQHRNSHRINNRCPNEFQAIGESQPGESADRAALDGRFFQPCAQCRVDERKRQSGRKTQKENDQHFLLQVEPPTG